MLEESSKQDESHYEVSRFIEKMFFLSEKARNQAQLNGNVLMALKPPFFFLTNFSKSLFLTASSLRSWDLRPVGNTHTYCISTEKVKNKKRKTCQ